MDNSVRKCPNCGKIIRKRNKIYCCAECGRQFRARTKKEEKAMEDIFVFIEALREAIETDQQEFTCPICGSATEWSRESNNGHVHCSCKGCGIRVAE